MDIHIHFEESEDIWIRNVVRRDVSSEDYNVWFVNNDQLVQQTFKTKQIKSVSVYKIKD